VFGNAAASLALKWKGVHGAEFQLTK